MSEFIILIVCAVLISICFLSFISLGMRKPIRKLNLPEGLREAFIQHTDLLLAPLSVKVQDAQLSKFKLLSEIPYEDGQFEYYSFDYNIGTERPVTTGNGLVLNSTELLTKAGVKGRLILLFFRKEEDAFEVSFLDDRDIAQKGYKGYISSRYANIKIWEPMKEYSLQVDGSHIVLWENLMGEPPFPFAVQTREHTQDILSYTAQFTDTWEGQELKITSWIQFERKKELVYWIKSLNPVAETPRGIHVGSTTEELKAAYDRSELSYTEDFKGSGPCYGFIPQDGTTRYIAFFVTQGRVREIWITDNFDERPFEIPSGYVDNDVEWTTYDYSEKLTERYAREIYIGQHKSDVDPAKVFNSFIAKELHTVNIIKTGLLHESPGGREYYIICQKKDDKEKLHVEVKLKRIKLKNAVTNGEIWVIDQHRSQIVTG